MAHLPYVLTLTAAIACLFAAGCATTPVAQRPSDKYRVYIGTYTRGSDSQGIYRFDFDSRTGQATEPVLAAEALNPSFLAIHPSGNYVYAVAETGEWEGNKTGSVAAYGVDWTTGNLRRINSKSSRGQAPCHLVVDPSGRNVLVANYVGGSVASLPIQSGGAVADPTGFGQHQGPSRANPQRQEAVHAHSINVAPGGEVAVAADLGADKLFIYRFDPQAGTLTPSDPPFAAVPDGGGPRHFAFHPSGKFAYTNNELTSSVTAFEWDKNGKSLTPIQTLSTLPQPHPDNTTAEIVAHPSGKFLYVSNRGHDSIAIFRINSDTGRLTPMGHTPTGGKIPRNFAIDPSGRWLLAANQDSGTVTIFQVNNETGALTPTGQTVAVPKPVCVRFLPLPS